MDNNPQYVQSTFATILPLGIKYELFWSLLAVLGFWGSGVILDYFGEPSYLITRLFIVFSVGLWPIIYIKISRLFYRLHTDCIGKLFIWENATASANWYKDIATKAFVLRKTNLMLTSILCLLGVITIYTMPLPFKSSIVNLVSRILLVIPLYIGMHSVPLIFYCVKALSDLSKKEIKINYYTNGYKLIDFLKKSYIRFSLIITIINLSLFLGFYYSPYGLCSELTTWIILISFCPIILYLSTRYSIQVIELKAQNILLDILNETIIAPSLDKLIANHKDSDFECVRRNIEFREYITTVKSKRIEFASILALITSILSGIFQIIATILTL